MKSEIKKSGFIITEIVSGTAPGADQLGERYAKEMSIPVKLFPAEWDNLNVFKLSIKSRNGRQYNALAGFNRNEQMAEYADCLIAFSINNSSGTTHMINLAKLKGIRVYIVNITV